MAVFNINVNDQSSFIVNKILEISTDCSTIYEYEVIAENGDNINISLLGDHISESYTLNGIASSFTDTTSVVFNNSLIIRLVLPNSGITGYFNNTVLSIENATTASSVDTFTFSLERENDSADCQSISTGDDNYVDSLTYDNVSGLLTLGRTGTLSDLTAIIAPPLIEDLATTQIIELGDIGVNTIEDGFNAHTFIGSENPIQDQLDGYVLINCIQNGLATQYLFIGAGGEYGTTGTLTAVSEDFTLIETTDLDYDVWRDVGGVNKAFSYNQIIRHGADVRAPLFTTGAGSSNGIRNEGTGQLWLRGNTSINLQSSNPNNGRVRITSSGAIGAWDNDRERYNLLAGRDYSTTVPYVGARKTLVGVGIEDTVFLNDATHSTLMDYAALYINPNIIAGTEADKIFSIYSYTGNVELNDGNIKFGKYGLNNVTGTPAYNLVVDANGNVIETALSSGGGTTPTIQEVLTQGNQISVGTELIFEGSFINSGSSLSNVGGALTANVNEYFSINRGGFELQFNPFVYGIISLDDYSLYTTGVPSTDRLIYAQRGYVDDAIANIPGNTSTGLEAIDEGNGIGWRFIGRDAANYGIAGQNSVDLGFSDSPSTTRGATGLYSFNSARRGTASGIHAVNLGFSGFATGNQSLNTASSGSAEGDSSVNTALSGTALGSNSFNAALQSQAVSFGEATFGIWGTTYTPADITSDTNRFGADRIFNIGIGLSQVTPLDGFTMLKDGQTGIGINNFEANATGERLQVNGVIKATGGISTNWNTAFSWGDHSSEGYLTSLDVRPRTPIVATGVSGTYNIDFALSIEWKITCVGATTITFSNYDKALGETTGVYITGAVPVLPATVNVVPGSEDFDASLRNYMVLNVFDATTSSEVVDMQNKLMTA